MSLPDEQSKTVKSFEQAANTLIFLRTEEGCSREEAYTSMLDAMLNAAVNVAVAAGGGCPAHTVAYLTRVVVVTSEYVTMAKRAATGGS